jgi:hypothetical protein
MSTALVTSPLHEFVGSRTHPQLVHLAGKHLCAIHNVVSRVQPHAALVRHINAQHRGEVRVQRIRFSAPGLEELRRRFSDVQLALLPGKLVPNQH